MPSPSASYTTETYDDRYFLEGGPGYTDYDAEASLLRRTARHYGNTLRAHVNGGRILDVGCASGQTLKGFSDAGWHAEGLEPNATMAKRAEAHGRPIHTVPMEDLQPALVARFDAIAMLQVVAHLRDVHASFANAARYLRAGGLLLVETWNGSSVTARVLGRYWHELSPPTVLRIFSPASLDALASRYQFRRVDGALRIKSILGSHAKSLLRHESKTGPLMRVLSSAAVVVPDNLQIPYLADDLFWHLYQLQPQH